MRDYLFTRFPRRKTNSLPNPIFAVLIKGKMLHERTITQSAFDVLESAKKDAEKSHNPYVTPEHVLFQIEASGLLKDYLESSGKNQSYFRDRLRFFFSSLGAMRATEPESAEISQSLRRVLESAIVIANEEEEVPVGIPHLLMGIAQQPDSLAGYLLRNNPEVLKGFGVIQYDL